MTALALLHRYEEGARRKLTEKAANSKLSSYLDKEDNKREFLPVSFLKYFLKNSSTYVFSEGGGGM